MMHPGAGGREAIRVTRRHPVERDIDRLLATYDVLRTPGGGVGVTKVWEITLASKPTR
jgi:hypothetical protein